MIFDDIIIIHNEFDVIAKNSFVQRSLIIVFVFWIFCDVFESCEWCKWFSSFDNQKFANHITNEKINRRCCTHFRIQIWKFWNINFDFFDSVGELGRNWARREWELLPPQGTLYTSRSLRSLFRGEGPLSINFMTLHTCPWQIRISNSWSTMLNIDLIKKMKLLIKIDQNLLIKRWIIRTFNEKRLTWQHEIETRKNHIQHRKIDFTSLSTEVRYGLGNDIGAGNAALTEQHNEQSDEWDYEKKHLANFFHLLSSSPLLSSQWWTCEDFELML